MISVIFILLLAPLTFAKALVLVAVTHQSCPVCQVWHEEVLPYYAFEAKAHHLPVLKSYNIENKEDYEWVFSHISGITALPTFIVFDEEREVGRFTGYRGYEQFFENLKSVCQE